MTTKELVSESIETCVEYGVQCDHSGGQGHCWRNCDAGMSADAAIEIAGEIAECIEECGDYVASNGMHYRW